MRNRPAPSGTSARSSARRRTGSATSSPVAAISASPRHLHSGRGRRRRTPWVAGGARGVDQLPRVALGGSVLAPAATNVPASGPSGRRLSSGTL